MIYSTCLKCGKTKIISSWPGEPFFGHYADFCTCPEEPKPEPTVKLSFPPPLPTSQDVQELKEAIRDLTKELRRLQKAKVPPSPFNHFGEAGNKEES